MAVVRLILRLSSSRPRPLAAVPALLRLVVVPCLNAHKRHGRDPPPFPITLLDQALVVSEVAERLLGQALFLVEAREVVMGRSGVWLEAKGSLVCFYRLPRPLKILFWSRWGTSATPAS